MITGPGMWGGNIGRVLGEMISSSHSYRSSEISDKIIRNYISVITSVIAILTISVLVVAGLLMLHEKVSFSEIFHKGIIGIMYQENSNEQDAKYQI